MTFDEFKPKITNDDATAASSRRVSPNRGASIPQDDAIGDERETQEAWRKSAGIDPAKLIHIVKVSHIRYQHPDLAEITRFLLDFGLTVVEKTDTKRWYKGYGKDQYVYYAQQGPQEFLGGAFEVESFEDLEKAAKISGATEIKDMEDAPGGGKFVTVTDPEGFQITLVHGQAPAEVADRPEILTTNYEFDKPRKARFQRFKPGPAAVHKLGHYGLCVQKFTEQVGFYTQNFNLVPTDFLYVDDPSAENGRKNVAVFLHVDRGADWTDHHTFFMSTNATSHVHHSSFEVHDFDTQNLGHEWLASKGYKSVWGVGRHILGSQLFDYWWDTTGNMIEHYADGDLVNKDTPVGYGPAGNESLAVWGPEVPKWFLD